MFTDTATAIQWAEAYAAKSNVKSQIGNLMKKGGGEPVFDIALSISARTSDCKPHQHALALKCMYGGPDKERDEMLGALIAEYLIMAKLDKEKPKDMLFRLGCCTVKAERALEVYNDSYPVKRMAFDVGVSREQFVKAIGWLEVRADAVEVLRNWTEAGIREMELWLSEQNWLNQEVV